VAAVFEMGRPEPAAYMARVAGSAAGVAYKERMLALLELAPGLRVADVGCGPGTDLAAMAGIVGDDLVVGVDRDPAMRERARDRGGVVLGGDVHALPFADSSVDRARTDRVLQHVEDPGRAVAELCRVVRPGGRVVMAEPDYETLIIDHSELELPRAYRRFIVERLVRNACVGRQLVRYVEAAGFAATVEVLPAVFRDARDADAVLGLGRNTGRAVDAGYLTAAQGRAFTEGLSDGSFFASLSVLLVVGRG
jgi:ubiquinone/menaquinone biosynthesis C-methylase UbiE